MLDVGFRTVLDKIQSNAPDYGHFSRRDRTKQLLHCNYPFCDLRFYIKNIPVGHIDNFSLKLSFLGRGAYVEVWRWEDRFATECFKVGRYEPDETVPGSHFEV